MAAAMRRAAAALLTLSLAVAGCGGEDTDARPERTSTPTPTTTTKFEPCAAPEQEPTARDLIGTPPKDYAVTSMDAESGRASCRERV